MPASRKGRRPPVAGAAPPRARRFPPRAGEGGETLPAGDARATVPGRFRCRLSAARGGARAFLLTAWLAACLAAWAGPAVSGPVIVLDPYRGVDWENDLPVRANLHAHTTESDGRATVPEVIAAYRRAGFGALAITDHDRVTWPWDDFGVPAAESGLVAIPGNEVSRPHHLGSYFCRYAERERDEHLTLKAIGELGGLAVFFHPGQYRKPAAWYLPFYRDHPHLLGMEVFNAGNRFPGDRALWDEILAALMPERPVWGFSNDDMHYLFQLGFNYNTLMLPRRDAAAVRTAMEQGAFFFSRVTVPGRAAPRVTAISIDTEAGLVRLEAVNCERVHWISEGRLVHEGPVLPYREVAGLGAYFRAELRGSGGETLTNPFGVAHP